MAAAAASRRRIAVGMWAWSAASMTGDHPLASGDEVGNPAETRAETMGVWPWSAARWRGDKVVG